MSVRTAFLIKKLESEITDQMTRALGDYDISPLQYSVLSFVESKGHHFSSAQLARSFAMMPQSMNEVVSILIRKELIDKSSDPNNKRVLRLCLTEKGSQILALSNVAMDGVEENLFGGLEEKELENFKGLLKRILAETHAEA